MSHRIKLTRLIVSAAALPLAAAGVVALGAAPASAMAPPQSVSGLNGVGSWRSGAVGGELGCAVAREIEPYSNVCTGEFGFLPTPDPGSLESGPMPGGIGPVGPGDEPPAGSGYYGPGSGYYGPVSGPGSEPGTSGGGGAVCPFVAVIQGCTIEVA